MRRHLAFALFRGPIPVGHAAAKHEGIDVLAEYGIDDAFALQECAFCFCFSWGEMEGDPELLEQLFGQKLRDGGDIGTGAFVSLEGWFVWAIEYEKRVDGVGYQAEEAIVECP